MNCLFLYNATQTYTNTVHEHLAAFSKYSRHSFFFVHHDQQHELMIKPESFDAIGIHYSVRLPYDEISESAARVFESFSGLKWLFIQDEYNFTYRAWHWIKRLGIDLVFTVVPPANINKVYPTAEFPNTRFVSVLTGYVPESIPRNLSVIPPSQREVLVGYRGRNLSLEYGRLGQEKAEIGRLVRSYAESMDLRTDIEWTEEARIYGSDWYQFVASCRSMLGSESGSNVFDWDGTLPAKVAAYREQNPGDSDAQILDVLIKPLELPGLMNQISPRIFESIALRTVLVLFEGHYSGILKPEQHYIVLRRDGSNLQDVFKQLGDFQRVDKLAAQAYEDLVDSQLFSYTTFVTQFDSQLEVSLLGLPRAKAASQEFEHSANPSTLTMLPIRAHPTPQVDIPSPHFLRLRKLLTVLWRLLPDSSKTTIKHLLRGQISK